MNIKNFSLVVLIAILYTSLMFYTAWTLFPFNSNDCWQKYAPPKDSNNPQIYAKYDSKINNCMKLQNTKEQNVNNKKLITIILINIIIMILLFLFYHIIINQGLFYGIILSSIIATITYHRQGSIIGLISLIVLMILIFIYIFKKESKVKK